jgi:hypothetical protein
LNGLDFWNNSFAIAADKKSRYGWIRTDPEITTKNGTTGSLTYRANWTDQQGKVQVKEITTLHFSASGNNRLIDRETVVTAGGQEALFRDAKDGMLAIRVTPALQLPSKEAVQTYVDDKGNATQVERVNEAATGNYLSGEGKTGDAVWSTRARWCQLYGRMAADTVSIVQVDHPSNPNYPTFWHARGYGLFAANPLGEKIFTNDRSEKNLRLAPGESAVFKYRIVVSEGKQRLSATEINQLADAFAKPH